MANQKIALNQADCKYLVVKGIAGLGNRMLAAMSGILFARLMHRRLVIDWSDFTYSNDGTNVFPLLFSCCDTEPLVSVPDTDSVSPPVWRGRLQKSASVAIAEVDPSAFISRRGYRRFSFDFDVLDHTEDVLVMWSYTHLIRRARKHFRDQFAGLAAKSDDEILSDLLHTSLLVRPELQAKITKWRQEHFAERPVIGVHIRFMDSILPHVPFINLRTSIDSFLAVIDRIVAKSPGAVIFIATDNREAQQILERKYSTVIATEKWFPTTGIEMHQNPECPDRFNNAVEALMDMYLLAECDYLVFPSSSTFSYLASLYTGMPQTHIIDVERNNPVVRVVKMARHWLT